MGSHTERDFSMSLFQELSGKLSQQKALGELCDVKFVQGVSCCWAHSCILASFSPFMMRYFVGFLRKGFDWSLRSPIKVDVSALTRRSGKSSENCMECVQRVVDFIYTGTIQLEPTHVEHVVSISSNMEIENLILICQKYKSDMRIGHVGESLIYEENNLESGGQSINCELSKSVNEMSLSNLDNLDVLECDSDTKTNVDSKEKSNQIADKNGTSCRILCDLNNTEPNEHGGQFISNNKKELPRNESDGVSELFDEGIEDNMEYSCKRCNVSFTDVQKLHQHEQIYHTRKFACLHCNFVSYKLIYMLKHLTESNHMGRVCSICLFESDDSVGMKRHLDDHRHNLPFMCSICSERFKTRTDWSRHSSAHTTDTSYVCKICDMSFKRNSYLHNHVLTHHSEPKHLCELCGYTTPFKSFLTRHKLKHSTKSIACPVENCEFTTAREANLRSHMKTHSAEKAFKCHICNVKFTQDKNLRRHMHLAHNPKATAFQCPGCCYVNSRIDKVKKHIADAHPTETTVMNQFQEKYEAAKRRAPSLLPKYSRSSQNAKERKKATFQPLAQEINSQMEDPLRTDIMQNPTDSTRTNSSKTGGSSMVKQTVLMSEATGEIAIMSIQEGQPIPVASLTSTSLLTIGNFREGTGSVTLNETTGVLTLNNINSESTGAVFLNESTGELSYINLNQESRQVDERPDKIQTDMSYDVEFSTLLNEETGEISTVQEQSDRVNNLCEDDMFDSFDIDAFNEDSFDCFDEFDGYLFDSFNPSGGGGGENEPTIENFLNEFTGELLKESSPLDNNTIVSGQSGKDIWDPVCSLEPSLGLGDMFSETKLNEFTGEFV